MCIYPHWFGTRCVLMPTDLGLGVYLRPLVWSQVFTYISFRVDLLSCSHILINLSYSLCISGYLIHTRMLVYVFVYYAHLDKRKKTMTVWFHFGAIVLCITWWKLGAIHTHVYSKIWKILIWKWAITSFIIGFYNFVTKFCWNAFSAKEHRGIGGYHLFIF